MVMKHLRCSCFSTVAVSQNIHCEKHQQKSTASLFGIHCYSLDLSSTQHEFIFIPTKFVEWLTFSHIDISNPFTSSLVALRLLELASVCLFVIITSIETSTLIMHLYSPFDLSRKERYMQYVHPV
jgi:hypothetical protein